MSNKISNINNATKILNKLLNKNKYSKKKQQKLKILGKMILNKTYKEIAAI